MTLQNRVTPYGELIADPARGLLYGNRGCLHDDHERIVRRHVGRRWIACLLEFKGWRHPLMAPRRFTGLFFLDEVTSLAAGHRPCVLCRRADYARFAAAWCNAHSLDVGARPLGVDVVDRALAAERGRPWSALPGDLPDGVMVERDGGACLFWGGVLHRWQPGGYRPIPEPVGEDPISVLTPRSTVATIAAGYRPGVHPSANGMS